MGSSGSFYGGFPWRISCSSSVYSVSPAHVLHLRCATSEFFGKPETFKHDVELMDIISELAAIKSNVSDPLQGKYRVMSTIKIVSDVSVTMSMFESQWKAYGWIQGLLSQQS
uniref:Uncharacterized protein n=1 Tax=Brassica campestris TaxID=3711 RepID=M4CFU6_BRACM